MNLRDKKVLLVGLGILGGGVATAKWLLRQGATLTITDIKDEKDLLPSLEKLKEFENKINYCLGRHEEKDFLNNEIIVINPDVPAQNHFVEIARKAGKQIENELTLFYKFAKFKTAIGITGTRGKTTTTNWTVHILKSAGINARILGNDPEKPFLSEIYNCGDDTVAVIETPSFQLEIFDTAGVAPHVAVITNIYRDHINRHKTMEGYALAKANIFKNQTEKDFLVLNKENEWTKFFLDQNPKGKVIFSGNIALSGFDKEKFSGIHGLHNLQNFLAAASACSALGVSGEKILEALESLPQIKWREELVYENGGLKIYNDTAATSPEASIAAMRRYGAQKDSVVFISGGTDRELDFKEWAKVAREILRPENLVLLSGSATEKMKSELGFNKNNEFDDLKECLSFSLGRVKTGGTIVFSPGAKSFEKFKNEFDRGEKFNAIVKEML